MGPGVVPPDSKYINSIVQISDSDPYLNGSSVMTVRGISLTYLMDYHKDVVEGFLDYDYV